MTVATELAAWYNGTPTGGPEGDGRYPLTYKDGTVYLVYCPAAQALNPVLAQEPVEIFAETAQAAANTATIESDEAQQASIDAQTHAANAAASATAANTSKNNAATSATNAATSATNAATARTAAETAQTKAEAWADNPVDDDVETGKYSAKHWAQKAADSAAGMPTDYVSLTGAQTISGAKTFTANPTIGEGTGSRELNFSVAPAGVADIRFKSNGANRWLLRGKNATAEDGTTSVGSDLQLFRYDDAGAVSQVFSITRSTGVVSFNVAPTVLSNAVWHAGTFNPASKQDALGFTPVNRAGDADITGILKSSSEIQSYSANSFRMVQGNYGVFWRNDGTTLYLLKTASGDQYGTWDTLRPFSVSLASGRVTLANGLDAVGNAYFTDGITVNSIKDGGGTSGIRLWGFTDTNWAIYMAQAGAGKSMSGGTAAASLSGRTAHHVRFRASTATGTTQGWIFENGGDVCVASLDADEGNLVTKGRQIATAPSTFVPTTVPSAFAMRTGGPYGGGYGMIDGATYSGMWTQADASGSILFGIGSSTSLTPRVRISVNHEETLVSAGRVWLQQGTGSAGLWFSNAANAKKWFWGSNTDSFLGLYNTTNSWVWQVQDDGRPQIKNANSGTMTTQPRIFVQSSDPGAAMADNDIWIQI